MKTRSAKRLGALALSILLCLAFAAPVFAAEPTVYTSDALTATRTRTEIAQRYSAALAAGETYVDGSAATYYTDPASLSAPYAQGVLSPDAHAAMTAMTNYYRWLVGAPALQAVSVGSDSLQKGALVRNFDFNHVVSASEKPEDMDDALWNEGAAARHNILALGYSPRGSIRGWLNEGYSLTSGKWDTVGHRMALLNADISDVQFGYAGACAIGVIAARANAPTLPFTAFPAPGDMPLGDVNARASAWTTELNPAVLSCGSGGSVVVTVTNLATGESYTCTQANGLLHPGQTLSFVQPTPANGTSYAEDESYRVTITGLGDVVNGGSATVDYTVTFFDVRNYMDAVVTSCTPVNYSNMYITNQMDNDAMLRRLALVLPQEIVVQTSVGRTFTLPVSGAWEPDAENSCWRNAVDASLLPDFVTDPEGVLANVVLTWAYPRVPSYTGQLTAVGAKGAAGANGSMTLARYMTNLEFAELYQFTQADGVESAVLRFDSDSPNHSVSSNRSTFAMEPWRVSDSGEWLGVYYSKTGYWHDAYAVGTLTASLTCNHASTSLVGAKEPTETEEGYTGDLVCDVCGEIIEQGEVIPRLAPQLTVAFRAVEAATGTVLDDPAMGLKTEGGIVTANPVAPSYLGYDVCGWSISVPGGASQTLATTDGLLTADALNAAIAALSAETGETSVTLTALYVRTADTYTVELSYTLPDGTVVPSFTTDAYLVGDAKRLTTSETFVDGENTYYFDHWLIDGKVYPTQSVTVRPSVPGAYAATAVYVAAQPETAKPVLAVADAFAETVNGAAKTGVTLTYSVPEGYTLKHVGFRVSTKDPTLQNTFSMATSKLTTPDGTYTVHINVDAKRDQTVYVCAFLIVTDASGAERTILTDPVGYVWNEL